MDEIPIDRSQKSLDWFIGLCKMLWERRAFFWGMFILGLILNTIASWLLIDQKSQLSFQKLPIGWIFQNPIVILSIGLLLLLITCIVYLGSRLALGVYTMPQRRYLLSMIDNTKMLAFRGVPVGLIFQSVPLD